MPRCRNCGIDIPWPPVVVGIAAFCCGGCAQGGPCYCSYDPPEPEPTRPALEADHEGPAPTKPRAAGMAAGWPKRSWRGGRLARRDFALGMTDDCRRDIEMRQEGRYRDDCDRTDARSGGA
jgi:hypothetical protein